jgi:hypothetical protein
MGAGRSSLGRQPKETIAMEELTDVRYEVDDGLAWIVIDRPSG